MRAILDKRQTLHDPKHFMANGTVMQNPEQPERVEVLQAAAKSSGCTFESPGDHGIGPIAEVHSAEYLTFLRNIHARWKRIEGASEEVIPNIHPARRTDSYPRSAVGQAGFHQADTACPISSGTWEAAYWSAQTAISAASVIDGGKSAVYALSRPPGHHAFDHLAGGFCFINNAAVAARWLSARGWRPAILDVDVHHGNGTQGIFYGSRDVMTVSIHADPIRFYPFFWGHAHERGEGAGLGYNLNLPLERGTGDDGYAPVLQNALDAIGDFGASVIIVALGLDAHENDPLKGLAISTGGFSRMATAIRDRGLPVLLVQEGGYLSPDLGDNLASFLGPFAG